MGLSGTAPSVGYQTPAAMGTSQVGCSAILAVFSPFSFIATGALPVTGRIPANTNRDIDANKIMAYFIFSFLLSKKL
jgi:hypothetical protein